MQQNNDLDIVISYLTKGAPAAFTLTKILQKNSDALIDAMNEVIPNSKQTNIPDSFIHASNSVIKNSISNIREEKKTKAINLLKTLSTDIDSFKKNLEFIFLHRKINDSTKKNVLNKRLGKISISTSLLFLINIYKEDLSREGKRIVKDEIIKSIKNKKNRLTKIRLGLKTIRNDIKICDKLFILELRGINNLSNFKKLIKDDLLEKLQETDYPNFNILDNEYIITLIKVLNNKTLTWSFIYFFYKRNFKNNKLLTKYIQDNDTHDSFSKILKLFVNNGGDINYNFWKNILFSFKSFNVQELLKYIDHSNESVQLKILQLINNVGSLDWNESTIKNPIRKKIKSQNPKIQKTSIEILEKNEHQKTLLPILSIINKGDKHKIQSLDLSILDQTQNKHPILFDKDLFNLDISKFPFQLTKDQISASKEIIEDMKSEERMYRLLQGDVASGKTEVVLLIMSQIINNKKQCVLLCPTNILANQQFKRISKFFNGSNITLDLLTRNTNKKKQQQIFNRIKSGKISILVGTHSVLDNSLKFNDLALAIIDEQQKFGVIQRSNLLKQNCHALELSATPIPRSLALRNHELINISNIKHLPKGRKYPDTSAIHNSERNNMMTKIKERIESGEQIYRVCKTISSKNYKSVYDIQAELKGIFPNKNIGLLHGKIPNNLNQNTLKKFIEGKINILISTTMIESGLDVPNAKCIVIENAESYGLSTLHQMRGRVSRDTRQGFCFLCTDILQKETIRDEKRYPYLNVNYYVHDNTNGEEIESSRGKNKTLEKQKEKIKYILDCFDGYAIAEKDLELSGGGEIKGTKQRGR